MSPFRVFTFLFLLLQLSSYGQEADKTLSRIIRSNPSDTAAYNIEMKDAGYDATKNKAPYFLIHKTTGYLEVANPTLVVKKTLLVESSHAAIIKNYFSDFITGQFTLQKVVSLNKNNNLNHYKLFPFRINASNQIEELVDYDVSWTTGASDNSSARSTSSFAGNSVLASGSWYKIGITQTGVYKLTKTFLSNIGINTNVLDPSKIKVYGNGGGMVPERNWDFRHDDLQETSIKVVLAADGSFDYALFYGTGIADWKKTNAATGLKYRVTKNLYSDTSFYFINVDLGSGKRVTSRASLSQTPDFVTNSYDYINFHEENIINLARGGRNFYGEYFDLTNSYSFSWNDGDFLNDTLIAEVALAALKADDSIRFTITGNGLNFNANAPRTIPADYSDFAKASIRHSKVINQNTAGITITVTKQTPRSLGWLDKITINARRSLTLRNKQYSFRDSRNTGINKSCNFSISNLSGADVTIWNVTDPLNPFEQSFNLNGSMISYTSNADSLNEYCLIPSTDLYTPVFVGKINNQNLHSITKANYIIVTHPLFIKEAEYLGAFHQQKEGLSYVVATTDQIYNEFSSGKQDIAGIRDFIRMIYNRTITLPENQQLKYVLLMGDGSFNNKNRNYTNNSNLVPTYQSNESLSAHTSIVTDDFYGLMDPNEGYLAEYIGAVDIGVGRFPCRTVSEVKAIIGKIENYYRKDPNYVANNSKAESSITFHESSLGDWRNWLLFLGDDEDNAIHMRQSYNLTKVVSNINPTYNIDKIATDAYQRYSTPGGFRYPDAAEDFLRRIKKGALIFNYTGHGGVMGLTEERLIDVDIINGFDNMNKLPLFITATCEFTRFDDPSRTSAGELCMLNPKGGAVALYSTCRVAYSSPNEVINREILRRLFTRLPNGKWPTIGDAIMLTKAALGQDYVYANFHLFGDPALRLAYPEEQVITTHINNTAVTPSAMDTLGALSKITIKGFVADNSGNKLSSFNGLVYPTVFDKEENIVCLMNSIKSGIKYHPSDTARTYPFEFTLQKNILYRGKSLVKNGEFSFTFIVPKDISFAMGPGKISYYATNGTADASGHYKQLLVGGVSGKNTIVDNEGPEVNLFLNDKNFVSGGLTNEKPVLFADLVDSSGINTLGTGIGHDITVILDENTSKPVILNDFYEANLNSYQSGRVRYPYNELSEGEHSLTFKVWDIQNNSSTVYTEFIVAKSAELALKHVLNYPNPFTTRTKFMFQHNQACNPLKVTVQIYTVTGKIVKTIQKSTMCEGSSPEGIEWDGRDDYGDKLGRGVYIYKLAILDVDNKKAEKIEKLVILN